ncbi:MAG: hypothetical protein WC683_02555 [bacterium]
MASSYPSTSEPTTGGELAVESGRLLIVPVARKLHHPMDEFCLYLPFGGDKLFVGLHVVKHPTKPKKHRVIELSLGPDPSPPAVHPESEFLQVGHVWGTLAMLFVGDPSFFYGNESSYEERERALQACRRESRPGGSFRCANGQVGACARLGDRDLRISPVISYGDDGTVARIRLTVPETPESPSED